MREVSQIHKINSMLEYMNTQMYMQLIHSTWFVLGINLYLLLKQYSHSSRALSSLQNTSRAKAVWMRPPVYHVTFRNVCFTSDLADRADSTDNQLNIHSQREHS